MTAEVRNPSGALTECEVKDNRDGTYIVEYTPYEIGNWISTGFCWFGLYPDLDEFKFVTTGSAAQVIGVLMWASTGFKWI